jgi:predicted permease
MSLRHRITAYVQAWLRRRRIEAEADEEIRFHLEMETEANRLRGLTDSDARRAALRDFGGITQAREGVRDIRTPRVESWWQDVRFAARLWRRQPYFTASALLTLAIGIGATTAIASAAYGVMVRPLPVHDESSLYVGYVTRGTMGDKVHLSWPAFAAWRDSGAFEQLAGVTNTRAELTDGVAERISIQQVTGNFFRVIGVEATIGRVFTEADEGGTTIPAVISDALWRSRFGADPNIVGRAVRAGRFPVTIVGVLPARVDRWREFTQMWIPIEGTVPVRELVRGYIMFRPVGRIAPGRVAATAERLFPITKGIEGERVSAVTVVSLRDDVSSPRLERILLVLLAAVVLTWLVVCANLSNLLLARGPARAAELTIRLAIGASRGRIIRQLLCETAVLSVPGGVLGVLVALLVTRLAAATGNIGALHTADLQFDGAMLVAACLLTFGSVLACGLGPALIAGRTTLSRGAGVSLGRSARRWSTGLVSAEIGVGIVVLVAATVLGKSVWQISRVDLGFDADSVLTFRVVLPVVTGRSTPVADDDRYVPAQRELLTRLSAVPGVQLPTLGDGIFVPGATGRSSLAFDDGRRYLNGEPTQVSFAPGMRFVGPDYFAVHGVRIVGGREFTARDDFGGPRVVIINQAMAALHWPDENPIGRRLNFGYWSPKNGFDEPWAEIVGVVANVRHAGIDTAPFPMVYRSALQYPRREFDIMLRTAGSPERIAHVARAEVLAFDPDVPVYATRALDDVVDDASADVRHGAALLGLLATITVGLAGIGVFSLLAYIVMARRRDLAIRTALGATPSMLSRSVLRHSFLMLVPGLVIGLAVAVAVVGSLRTLLYEVEPLDASVFAGVATVTVVVSLLAAYIPARRAGRLDPISALKES